MNSESRLLNAVCKNKDISTVMSADIDDMMVTHGDVWQWLRSYYLKHKAVPNAEVVAEKFDDFDVGDVGGETVHYLDELRNDYLNDKLAGLIEGAAKRHGKVPGSQLVEELMQRVATLAKDSSVIRDISLTDVDDALQHYDKKHELAIERDGAVGIRTGFKVMDAMYPTGMAGGHLVVLIGWSGHGKSWFGTLAACRAWAAGYKPMIISLEMSPEEVRDRAYTIMGSGLFRHSDFARGMIGRDRFENWAKKSLEDKHDFIVVSSEGHGRITPSTVQTKIDQHRPDLVILDYQQLFDSDEKEGSEVVRNRRISREFKRLAVRNDIPIINLTQATFDDPKDTDEPPRIEQVAWSKGIQQDADLALSVHKYTDSDMWSIIARKNRHGEEFAFGIEWDLNNGVLTEKV
ncbi:MAG: hypothetical protein LC650_01050 [Actinobacteria bacterium]|nr:hypothetical protein [Actinomycetota bacterium]